MTDKKPDAQRLVGPRQKVDTAELQALGPRERLNMLVGALASVGGNGAGDGAAFRKRLETRLEARRQARLPTRPGGAARRADH